MIEATLTLFSGKTITIVAATWTELSEQLEKLPPIKKMVTRQIQANQMRQGKYMQEGV